MDLEYFMTFTLFSYHIINEKMYIKTLLLLGFPRSLPPIIIHNLTFPTLFPVPLTPLVQTHSYFWWEAWLVIKILLSTDFGVVANTVEYFTFSVQGKIHLYISRPERVLIL